MGFGIEIDWRKVYAGIAMGAILNSAMAKANGEALDAKKIATTAFTVADEMVKAGK